MNAPETKKKTKHQLITYENYTISKKLNHGRSRPALDAIPD